MATQPSVWSTSQGTARILDALRAAVDRHLAALTFRAEPAASPGPVTVLLVLVIQLAGLGAFWRYYHQPVWLAIPTLAILLVLPILAFRSRHYLAVETLAPLFFLYAILIARVIAVRVLLANEPYQDEASFADPRFIAFQVEATAAAVLGYLALVQILYLVRTDLRTRAVVGLAAIAGGAAFAWFGAETVVHRTQGVTATDPYAYAQMAVDLATRGTLLHSFPLFQSIANLGVSWYPIEHIGYRLFDNLSGMVPTVWPFGGSLWLALAYRVGGEQGLYLATPIAGLAALVAMAALAWEYLSEQTVAMRAAVAALAVLLLATSWEQVDRSIVPLVDVQAQLFSIVAIQFALRAGRHAGSRWALPLVAGGALGAAYLVRHTQVLLAPVLAVAVWVLAWRERLRFLVLSGSAAFVVALPDLWYHRLYLGGWLTPESHEMALFGVSSIATSVSALGARFFAGNEFGYLAILLLYGVARAGRDNSGRFMVLAVWLLVLAGFHILYEAVKLRDLLPEYPAVVLLTAYGMASLARDFRNWAGQGTVRRGVAAIAIYLVLLMPAMRDRITIMRPLQPAKVTFGYVTAEQRESFDRIAALTTANSVIGSTMNDGAIDMYARRDTFRPGGWNADERGRFLQLLLAGNRPVYLLDDGTETSAARLELETSYTLQRIAVLDVPLFGNVAGTPGALYQIREK